MSEQARQNSLVVLSNRLPVTVRRARGRLEVERSSGGLVSALDPILQEVEGTWIGWPGTSLRPKERLPFRSAYRLEPLNLTRNEVRHYYHGFSNGTLWPLFHSFPERMRLDRRDWNNYEAVNERFAEAADRIAKPDDLIWIHDYHLTRAAGRLRQLRPAARIAFFLHIPFPPYDVFRILPWDREVLRGLLCCDLVGLHCAGYVTNLLDCAERLLGARVDRSANQIELGGRTIQVGAFPLGIDFEGFEGRARLAPEAQSPAEKVILGVDRLDYTKGIPERIHAFAELLERHREYRERIVLVQIAVPSRSQVTEYQDLKREIDELVGRVNGRFATHRWTPIHYLYRSVSPERLAALYRDADVALVTPLRDGMNLVAKEYVASQVADPGVLVLSRLAGAAETMYESLQVNPYNVDAVAGALHRALTMDLAERTDRMVALRTRERRFNLLGWLDSFLEAARSSRYTMGPPTDRDFEAWLARFLNGRRLALFLDYDGTLTPIVERPEEARFSPSMRAALADCVRRRDTDVTIVSGRSLEDVMKMVDLKGVTFAGNHGLEITGPGLEPFVHEDAVHFTDRARELARRLGRMRTPGVWVEEKGPSLTVHYRSAPVEQHARVAELARARIQEAGFQPRDAHCAIEARPPIGWDKGHAVLHVVRARYGQNWSERIRVIYAGDDDTDEDAFNALAGMGITFRVAGSAEMSTRATRHIPNVESVEALLRWLAQRPEGE
ncbi:MAG: bifunctional alpha,alpha-trehalose-phosphate synthase (UDP-forming)/trehalose-phosphatase [Myxococcota bacterium]